ncbi:MAG: hypothetical protein ACYDH2_13990, partial [Anaerolineaceae bacterium]
MTKENINLVLKDINEFISLIAIDNNEINHISVADVFFSIADLGTLILDGNDAINYKKCLLRLINCF